MSTRKRLVEQRRQSKQRATLYAVIATILVAAAVLAVVLSRQGNSTSATAQQTRPVTTTGDSLPTFGTTPDPAIGSTIPTITGTNFDGTPVRVSDDGKAKVLLFVTHWCPHCRKEVPLLANDLRQKPLPSNVEMITISTSVNANAPNYPPSQWLADVNWPTPVLADDSQNSAGQAFGLTSFPYLVFVDAHNRVVSRSSGEMTLTEFHKRITAIAK